MDWGKVPNGMFPFWTHDNSAVGLKAELDAGRGGPDLQSQGLLGWYGPWETLEQFDWYFWGDLTLLGWLRNWQNPKGGFLELTPESGVVCIRVCLPCCGTFVCSLPILPQSSQSRKGNTGCDCGQRVLRRQDAFSISYWWWIAQIWKWLSVTLALVAWEWRAKSKRWLAGQVSSVVFGKCKYM